MLRLTVAAMCAVVALTSLALADIAEQDYATEAFGTVAVFDVAAPLVAATEYGYWTDNLPEQLSDSMYLVETANAARQAEGRAALSETTVIYYVPGEYITDERTAYELSFEFLTPADVRAILAASGNLAEQLPGGKLSFRPLTQSNVYFSTLALDEALQVDHGGVKVSFPTGTSSRVMFDKLSAAYKQRFGDQTLLNGLYYGENAEADGSGSRSLSYQVDIAPVPHEAMYDEEFEG